MGMSTECCTNYKQPKETRIWSSEKYVGDYELIKDCPKVYMKPKELRSAYNGDDDDFWYIVTEDALDIKPKNPNHDFFKQIIDTHRLLYIKSNC